MKIRTAGALALLAAAPAFAQTVKLDFEGTAGFVNTIGQFYNGGTDGLGNTGPNYGVSFTDGAVALSNDALGPYYADAPSPLAVMYAFDSNAFMNVVSGFSGALGFAYSSTLGGAAVNIYSGLNGTGTLLASASLLANASTGCTVTTFCNFDATSLNFAGIGRSVGFGGNPGEVLFDDVSITAVPEPSTYLMLALGLAAVGFAGRRRDA